MIADAASFVKGRDKLSRADADIQRRSERFQHKLVESYDLAKPVGN